MYNYKYIKRKYMCLVIGLCAGFLFISPPGLWSAALTTEKIMASVSKSCELWVKPSPTITSLQYTFDVNGEQQEIKIVKGKGSTDLSYWRGITLASGFEFWLANSTSLSSKIISAPDKIILEITSDKQPIYMRAGNGISGFWKGYFSTGSQKMMLEIDPKSFVPLRERHEGTEIIYDEWLEVSPGKWVPMRIDVMHGGMIFHMHFKWLEKMLWIIDYSDYEINGRKTSVARVNNIVLNNRELEVRVVKEEKERERQIDIIHAMLEHNELWLRPELRSLDSLHYIFRTVREDIDETCYVDKNGLVIFEVRRDGKDNMHDYLGARKIILPGNEYYFSYRGDDFASIQPQPEKEEQRGMYEQKLRRYATIGVQFDLPLFDYYGKLPYATVTLIREDKWQNIPCYVVEVSGVSASYLGAGTMLGFSSWSYVHNIEPKVEIFHIDKNRMIPLHETLISSRDDKIFDITFENYIEPVPGQFVPLSISIEAKDYFTCHYTFHLFNDTHWMLKEMVSWFKPEDKSQGKILEIQGNSEPSLRNDALAQVEAGKKILAIPTDTTSTREIKMYPFIIGKHIPVEIATGKKDEVYHISNKTRSQNYSAIKNVLFTLNEAGDLVAHCDVVSADFFQGFSLTINTAIYDEDSRLLSADTITTPVALMNAMKVFPVTLNFGFNDYLADAKYFSMNILKSKDVSLYHGHGMWMKIFDSPEKKTPQERHFVWNIADGLTAEDPQLWSAALNQFYASSPVIRSFLDSRKELEVLIGDYFTGKKREIGVNDFFPKDTRNELFKPLVSLYQQTDSESDKTKILMCLAWFSDIPSTATLITAYNNATDEEPRMAAATSLGILGDTRGLDLIIKALKSDTIYLRSNAIWALSVIGSKTALDSLTEALFYQKITREPAPAGGYYIHNPYGETRWAVIKGLAMICHPDALAALRNLREQHEDYYINEHDLDLVINYMESRLSPINE